ncbi:hypothetical protein EMIT0P100_10986 [Pseudomonas sp. IT-P100]
MLNFYKKQERPSDSIPFRTSYLEKLILSGEALKTHDCRYLRRTSHLEGPTHVAYYSKSPNLLA